MAMENSPARGGGEEPRGPAADPGPVAPRSREPTVRTIMRVVVTVVLSALALYVVYLVRTPLSYLVMATFVAVVVSAPVNRLSKRMPRGLAILIVYTGVILIPIGIGAVLIPPAVTATISLVNQLPAYVQDVEAFVQDNQQLQNLNEDFDLTGKLQEVAEDAATDLDDAAAALADVGAGLVGSMFGGFTVLILSIFMVSRGRGWTDAALRYRPAHQAEAIRRALDHMAFAVSAYVGGALAQATIAGIAAFAVLSILGVESPLALAVIVAILDLIPLIGATIGAVIVGLVTLFTDFPTATIIWAGFAIGYQQFENYVIQPRIQSYAVSLDPFIIVVAALFGGFLIGIVGALLAIPTAAALQIAVREVAAYRRDLGGGGSEGGGPPPREEGAGPDPPPPGEGGAAPEPAGG
jgi:predicted PurR-regulated permease PerM